jgi:hypothetical protein
MFTQRKLFRRRVQIFHGYVCILDEFYMFIADAAVSSAIWKFGNCFRRPNRGEEMAFARQLGIAGLPCNNPLAFSNRVRERHAGVLIATINIFDFQLRVCVDRLCPGFGVL